MKKILVIITVISFSGSAFAQNINKLLSGYNEIKNALVNSDGKAASEAAIAFQQTIINEDEFSLKADLQKAVDKMAKAGNIEKQRETLNSVSIILWKIVSTSDSLSQPIYYQYCSMKKAYWLSMEKDIKNPYYGSSMLTCGKVVEIKK